MTVSVAVKDLTLKFGSAAVLKNMSLEVQDGEFIVLLGPSGCGKSTLLNCIAGLLDISDGQIWIKGKNVTWEEPSKRGIGMVFQSYALYPQMTVRGNLSFGLKTAGVPRASKSSRCWTASRAPCRGVSASALPSAGPWCAMSTSSSLTSLCPTSTPNCGASCGWS
jgi:ABC-type sugar transport system ATPase subunit